MIRKQAPGSNWIYFKIYIARSYSDTILIKIFKVFKKYKEIYNIEKVFFIRYGDPNYHIRLRILLIDDANHQDIIKIIYNKLNRYLNNDIIWKIQIDTYIREMERYNSHLIEVTESLFSADSTSAIDLINYIEKFCTEDYRWMICLTSIDFYLNSFSTDLNTKLQLITNLSDSFKLEFGYTDENKKMKNLNKLFRENRLLIENIFHNKFDEHIFNLTTKLKQRNKNFISIVSDIKNICNLKQIHYNDYIGSYIHMNINRIIPAENRLHEMILYDFVKRFYEGELARSKYLKTTSN